MTIRATDLISPSGPLETRLFPGESSKQLVARITGYISVAFDDTRVAALDEAAASDEDEAKVDRLVRAYALYRAYLAVYQRMLAEPNSVTQTEKGSSTYTDKQRDGMLALANAQLAAFEAELVVEVAATPARKVPPTSARICLSF